MAQSIPAADKASRTPDSGHDANPPHSSPSTMPAALPSLPGSGWRPADPIAGACGLTWVKPQPITWRDACLNRHSLIQINHVPGAAA